MGLSLMGSKSIHVSLSMNFQRCLLLVVALGLQINILNQCYEKGPCECHILGCQLSLLLAFTKTKWRHEELFMCTKLASLCFNFSRITNMFAKLA